MQYWFPAGSTSLALGAVTVGVSLQVGTLLVLLGALALIVGPVISYPRNPGAVLVGVPHHGAGRPRWSPEEMRFVSTPEDAEKYREVETTFLTETIAGSLARQGAEVREIVPEEGTMVVRGPGMTDLQRVKVEPVG